MKSIEFYKEEFFLEDREIESFKEFIKDNSLKIYKSKYSLIEKKANGDLVGFSKIPPEKSDDFFKEYWTITNDCL